MNTQYIKTPLLNFVYRLIISVLGGGMILYPMLTGKLVYLYSFILLLIALPIMYNSLFALAQYDQKKYHETTPYGAKGTVMAAIMLIPVALVLLLFGFLNKAGNGFLFGMSMGYRLVYTPYMALIGLTNNGFTLSYILPVIIDIAVMTLGYIAGMSDHSVTRIIRENLIYSKRDDNNKR